MVSYDLDTHELRVSGAELDYLVKVLEGIPDKYGKPIADIRYHVRTGKEIRLGRLKSAKRWAK